MQHAKRSSSTSIRYGAIQEEGSDILVPTQEAINMVQLEELYGDNVQVHKTTLKRTGKRLLLQCCNPFTGVTAFWKAILGFMPILQWLPKYSIKECLLHDIVGGLTTGVMHVPQGQFVLFVVSSARFIAVSSCFFTLGSGGIAYSILAGVDPVNGLYASCFPAFFYMFFGTSRHVSIGSFAVVALMAGVANDNVRATINEWGWETSVPGGNQTLDLSQITPTQIASTLTFALGIIQFLCGVCHAQFLASYFSDQLVSGFTAGAAVHVLIAQIDDVMGVKVPKSSGPGYIFVRLYDLAVRVPQINYAALTTSIIAMSFIYTGKEFLSPALKKHNNLKFPIPYELILVAVTAAVSFFADFEGTFGVDIVDEIPTGMPRPVWPIWSILPVCLLNVVGIAVVTIAVHISMAKMLAKKMNYEIDTHQELYALGLTAMYGGLFPVYPVSTALGRTMVNVGSGTKTQLSSVFSCLLLMTIILWLGPLLQTLPMCVLASIILVALKSMFMKCQELSNLAPVSKVDLLIWWVSFLATVSIDVIIGLGISVAFALITVVFRSQWPRWQEAMSVPSSSAHSPVDVCTYRFDAPLMFINAERFRKSIRKCIDEWTLRIENENKSQTSIAIENSVKSEKSEKSDSDATVTNLKRPRFFVIDCSLMPYIDFMGAGALIEITQDISSTGVVVFVAAMTTPVRQTLENAKFYDVVQEENTFPTLRDALVTAYRNGQAANMLHAAKKEQLKREKSLTADETQTETKSVSLN